MINPLALRIAKQLATTCGCEWDSLLQRRGWLKMAEAVLAMPEIDEALRAFDELEERLNDAREDGARDVLENLVITRITQ